MAGEIKVAVVSGAISSTGTGTADFTKVGFGTPKACIVLLSFDTTDNTSVSIEGKASIGFSDFTNHRCITHQDEDASAKVDSDARKSPTKAYVLLDVAAAVDIDGTASTITNGVRLTNTTNGSASAVFATVIMFGGTDLQISLDTVAIDSTIGNTTVVTTSIPQDLVFFIGTDLSGEDSSGSGINNSFGVVDISNDQATIVNRCMGWASDHNNNVGSPASIIRTDRCLKVLTETAGDDWGVELTAATTTSYTITTRDVSPGAGMEIYALALDLDDRGSKIGSVDSPTAGATWTPSVALGFTPQYVGLGVTHAQAEGTIEADADAGGLGISSNTGLGEETFHGWYDEDASAAANTNNNFRSRVLDFRNDDVVTIVHDHSHSSFNNGDWTYTINTENETTARKWFYWAIEEGSIYTSLVVRYHIDEAASGQGPANVLDDSVAPDFDLGITYAASLNYQEISGNRGLENTSTTGDQITRGVISDTTDKVRDNLAGSKVMTMELVTRVDDFSSSTGRCFAIQANNSSNSDWGFNGTSGTAVRIYWNATLVRTFDPGTARAVWHIVVDTNLATANDRIKIYKDSVLQSPTIDANPAQNATLTIVTGVGTGIIMFNRGTAPRNRSMDGVLFYAALYSNAFSQADVNTQEAILTPDDDTPVVGGLIIPVAIHAYRLSHQSIF